MDEGVSAHSTLPLKRTIVLHLPPSMTLWQAPASVVHAHSFPRAMVVKQASHSDTTTHACHARLVTPTVLKLSQHIRLDLP